MTEKARNSLLYLDGVTVSFDGFKALNDLSLVIEPGEMRAIIGPNGAGKTTMMDVVTGKTRPDAGDVYFDGTVDLTRLDEAAIADARHRPQVPEADRLREPHRVGQSRTGACRLAVAGRSAFRRSPVRRRPSASSEILGIIRLSTAATCAPPISATARSSGWRSACCSPRSRSCCSSTSRPPA